MRIGIIGTGIAGMTAAHLLQKHHEVHVFEADDRPGGHANTVTVDLPGGPVAADTGFLVYNERTYPLFTRLLADLGVATHPSEMSFSLTDLRCGLEWRGTSLSTVFAQRRNALRPAFLAMLADVVRFNRLSRALLSGDRAASGVRFRDLGGPLGRAPLVARLHGLVPDSAGVGHLVGGPRDLHADPGSDVRGILQPSWPVGPGRSARVAHGDRRIGPLRRGHPRARPSTGSAPPVQRRDEAASPRGRRRAPDREPARFAFDHVVVATHSDQALALLGDPTDQERRVLGALRYQPNRATLHTDTTLLPSNRRAWASWNYVRPATPAGRPTLTYYLNRLQGLEAEQPVLVTLNRDEAIDPDQVVAKFDYAHPVIDQAAVAAQASQGALSAGPVSYCGAYWGYGFHEDGVRSALAVCERFGARM